MQELYELQKNIKAAKNKRNNFGNYDYRTAEGILSAAKAVIPKGCTITMSDSLEEIGGQIFLKATVIFENQEGKTKEVTACAAHTLDKKGMDKAQMTGAASSYARKYALQGLLAIDDGSIDPDATNTHGKAAKAPKAPKRDLGVEEALKKAIEAIDKAQEEARAKLLSDSFQKKYAKHPDECHAVFEAYETKLQQLKGQNMKLRINPITLLLIVAAFIVYDQGERIEDLEEKQESQNEQD